MKRFIVALLVCFVVLPMASKAQDNYVGTDSRAYVITEDYSVQPTNDDDRTQTDN